jgi:hypothetical protein
MLATLTLWLSYIGLTPAMLIPLLGWGLLTGFLNLLVGRRTQVEAWCKLHPRVAGALSMLRASGFDPWKYIDGAAALATGRWSAATKGKIAAAIKLLAGGGLIVLMVGCAAGQPTPKVSVGAAVEVATWAVVLTDDALVVAAKVAPDNATLDRIEQATDLLDGARGALSEGIHTVDQVCEALGQVSQVATMIDCKPCSKSAQAALDVVCGGVQ